MLSKLMYGVFVFGIISGAVEWITSSSAVYDFSKDKGKKPAFVQSNFVPVNSVSSPALGNQMIVYITNLSGKKLKKAEVKPVWLPTAEQPSSE